MLKISSAWSRNIQSLIPFIIVESTSKLNQHQSYFRTDIKADGTATGFNTLYKNNNNNNHKSLFTTRVVKINMDKNIQLQQYTLKLIITIFIKFRFYTLLNMKTIMKFSQIIGHIQILYLFIIIPKQK